MAKTTDAEDLASFLNDGENEERVRNAHSSSLQLSVEELMARIPRNDLDEIHADTLKRCLLTALPREENVLALVNLLQGIEEESIPLEAVASMWRKLNGAPSVLRKRAKSASSMPILRSRVLESKRKQAENDVQLLQNRILLLQQEEQKAWKKIVQTKERAQEILELRQANLRRQEQKQNVVIEREKESHCMQRRQHSIKKESVIKKKHAAIQIISKKYQDVELVKSESKRLKAEKERIQMEEVQRAKEKREAVRKAEDALKRKKQRDRVAQDQEVILRLMKKVILEQRTIKKHERKVQAMENAELALIQRLQGTKLIQREAYSVLEQALLRSDRPQTAPHRASLTPLVLDPPSNNAGL